MEHKARAYFVGIGFIFVALMSRFLPHPPNLTALGALALFAPAVFSSRWGLKFAILAPLAVLFVSDLVFGFYPGLAFVYASFALMALLGAALRPQKSLVRAGLSVPLASVIFFVVTNFGVWLMSGLYPKTAAGLVESYVMAIPFFGNQFLGNAIFVTAFAIAYRSLVADQTATDAVLSGATSQSID